MTFSLPQHLDDASLNELLREVDNSNIPRYASDMGELSASLQRLAEADKANDHLAALATAIRGFFLSNTGDGTECIPVLKDARDRYLRLNLDTNAALVILRLGEIHLHQSNVVAALGDYKDAYQYLRAVGERALVARAAERIAIATFRLGHLDEAMSWFTSSMEAREQLGHTRHVLGIQANMGNLLLERGDLDGALRHYQVSLEGFEAEGDLDSTATLATNIGILYAESANYPLALEYLHKAYEAATQTNNTRCIISISGALGEVYHANGEFEKALRNYQSSLALSKEIGDNYQIGLKHIQLGMTLLALGKLDEASHELESAITLHTSIGNTRELHRALAHLALVRLKQHRVAEAREYIDQTLKNAQQGSSERELLTYEMIDASVAKEEGNVGRCLELLEVIIDAARQAGKDKELADALHLRYAVYRSINETEPALIALEQFYSVHERILGVQKQRRVAILEAEQRISEQARQHERAIAEERRLRAQQRSLLTNMLPEIIADRLMNGENMIADAYQEVSVMFLDLVDFTMLATRIPPEHLIHHLNSLFSTCDAVIQQHGLTKVKTIGDCYMAIAGAPQMQADNVVRMAKAMLALKAALDSLEVRMPVEYGDRSWVHDVGELNIRMGVHCGAVSAGVIGEVRMAYDVWGDAVNVAARLEQMGQPGQIHVSSQFRKRLLEQDPTVAEFISRGLLDIKGKGPMETWWMVART